MATEPPVVITATPEDVAALLRARTKDSSGQEIGAWTTETRPTLEQVEEQIAIATELVELDVGLIPAACVAGANRVTALLAALLVEQSYWPEQVQSERSAYDKLLQLYERYRQGLVACVQGNQPGGDTEATWRVYDVRTPSSTEPDLPLGWWQADLDNKTPDL